MTETMTDTSCRKCGAKMDDAVMPVPQSPGPLGRLPFTITAYRCKKCGHWNDLKSRKANKKAGE